MVEENELEREYFDLEEAQKKLSISRELPIIDEEYMKGISVPKINEFLNGLSVIIFGERTYGVEYDNFLSIYPLSKEKDFGVRIRFIPGKIPPNYFPAIFMIDHITSIKRGETDSCLEESVSLYSILENKIKEKPLFKALRIHREPANDRIEKILLYAEKKNSNGRLLQMFKSESLG